MVSADRRDPIRRFCSLFLGQVKARSSGPGFFTVNFGLGPPASAETSRCRAEISQIAIPNSNYALGPFSNGYGLLSTSHTPCACQ
jgi:hypothetical protein